MKKVLTTWSITLILSTANLVAMEDDAYSSPVETSKTSLNENSSKVTLISNDGQKITIDYQLAKRMEFYKDKFPCNNEVEVDVSGFILCSLVRLLKCLNRPVNESDHKDFVLAIVRNIKNPATIDTLIQHGKKLEIPPCILNGLECRTYSIQELLDNAIEFPISPPGTLNLSGKKISSLDGLENIPTLPLVKALNLSNNFLEQLDFKKALKACKHIKRLYLTNNRITKLSPKNFSKLHKLKYFHCANNQIHTLPENLFKDCKKLIFVDLDNNSFETISPKAFNKNITHVFLKND